MSTKTKPKPAVVKPPRPALPPAVVGLLNRDQVCVALGNISLRKLAAMVSTGEFPRSDKRVGKSPRWSVTLFNRWVEELPDSGPYSAAGTGNIGRGG